MSLAGYYGGIMPTKTTKKSASEAKQLAELSPQLLQHLLRLNSWVPEGDITPQQFKVLQSLALSGKAMTMSEISRSLGLGQSTLSETVKRLVTAGYVTRQRSPEDDRVVSVAPTRKGRLAIKQARARLHAAYRKLGDTMDSETTRKFVESHRFLVEVLRSVLRT